MRNKWYKLCYLLFFTHVVILLSFILFQSTTNTTRKEEFYQLVKIMKPYIREEKSRSTSSTDQYFTMADRNLIRRQTDADGNDVITYYGDKWTELLGEETDPTICLATHATINRLYWVPMQASLWAGLISLAVYVPLDEKEATELFIKNLRFCSWEIREYVKFTLVVRETRVKKRLNFEFQSNCSKFFELLVNIYTEIELDRKNSAYPQNLMRNIARKQCHSTYAIDVDVDMISGENMARHLSEFLYSVSICKTCAYIVPVYEIKDTAPFPPKTKTALLLMRKQKQARVFHVIVFRPNQHNTKLPRWEWLPRSSEESKIRVMYNISSYQEFWEPIMVLHSSAPDFIEEFVGYGMTRSSHVYLLHHLNFTFHVLDNAFLSHFGFQTSRHYDKSRKRQILINKKLYTSFKADLTNYVQNNYELPS